jgi:hypothetical protein
MVFANYEAYLDALELNRASDFQSGAIASAQSRPIGLWQLFTPGPTAPTASVALDKNSLQSIGSVPNVTSGKLQIIGGSFTNTSVASGALMAVDVLNISGGMSAIVTTEQTTNLPTAALTRHTTGEGVMLGLLILALIGTTATTVTVRYTNQNGTPNRISPATVFGGSGFRETNRFIIIPLQAGDTGVRSVEGVTVAGTTSTAGNFGVCLLKPLTIFDPASTSNTHVIDAVSTGGMIGAMAEFDSDACVSIVCFTSVLQNFTGALLLAEA